MQAGHRDSAVSPVVLQAGLHSAKFAFTSALGHGVGQLGRRCSPRLALAVAALLATNEANSATRGERDPEKGWTRVESLQVIGPNRHGYTLTVEDNPEIDATPRLRVAGPNGRGLKVQQDGGLIPVAKALEGKRLLEPNSVGSKYVYIPPTLKDPSNEIFLIVFGWAYASDPGSIRIVKLDRDSPKLVFSAETFELEQIIRLNGGHEIQIVGRRSLSQLWGKCLSTYDPYAVFKMGSAAKFEYSAALSKGYNLTHRYVWAGPDSREDVAVDECASPRKLVPAKEVKARSR